MKALLRSLFQHLRGLSHGLLGRIWFRLGRGTRARHHFERVLSLRGDDFAAYVYLGRLAYCVGDYAAWRREYEHARRTCPDRFARLRHPFEPIEPRDADILMEESGRRATWRAVGVTGVPPAIPAGRMQSQAAQPVSRAAQGDPLIHTRLRDDFATAAEREKFRALEPIRPADIAATDLDELAALLIE